jgi:uncharacterized protein YprB with RNaseH-like and TPR domain
MRVGIFDLETSSRDADWGIILCCSVAEYGKKGIKRFRADDYSTWKTNRADDRHIVKAIVDYLMQFDILVAHNGQFFDKAWLLAKCIKYGIPQQLRYTKFVDPVRLSRRNLKLGSNGLNALIYFLDCSIQKTKIDQRLWLRAAYNGDSKALSTIVYHCDCDVKSLMQVYDKMRPLIERIDNRGSAQ